MTNEDKIACAIETLRHYVQIQGENGNWNYDDYMVGMFNGLELALATMEGREPQYRTLKVAQPVAEPSSTALPPLRSLTLSTDLEPASHQVRAAFGSASLKG
jgi:hypothetical protein